MLKDKIISKDFLRYDISLSRKFAIIGNFPYNISTQIVLKRWSSNIKFLSLQECFKKR
jgi:16S rRNA A1518/A1519 N6-dimethyltransferase RsmA/KsgA/DIM1 with predicted DNA glycosylase/AP lyase activity